METTRADFLSRGAKGGLALVAGGSVLAMTNGRAFGSVDADTDIAKLAATAELLAIDFYTRSIRSRKLKGAEAAYLAAALQNEKDHYKALAGVLGRAAPKNLRFKYPAGTFGSARSIGRTGQALETAFVGAYLGAVKALKSNDLKAVAAQIGNNESRHLAILSNIAAGTIVSGPSFPKALTAAQATRALTPFLA
ncbi:MAG: ferritin-like domain-containing protein [Gaiellaceae bacterium]